MSLHSFAAANYAEVRAGESKNDFIHKLGIVREELCECMVWLRLIARKHLVPTKAIEPTRDECDQLVRIVSASKITAERNARLGKKKKEEEDEESIEPWRYKRSDTLLSG